MYTIIYGDNRVLLEDEGKRGREMGTPPPPSDLWDKTAQKSPFLSHF